MPEHFPRPFPEAAAARRELAALRAARGEGAPTLGWLFADTPGAPSRDDGAMGLGLVAVGVEEWAASAWA